MARPRRKAAPPGSVGDRLRELMDKVHPADRGPFDVQEIAEMTKSTQYPPISASYVDALLRGERDNPTVNTIQALAAVFHVPAAYFFDDTTAEEVQANIALTIAVRDSGMADLVNRSAKLSPAGRRALAGMITSLQNLEDETTDRSSAETVTTESATESSDPGGRGSQG